MRIFYTTREFVYKGVPCPGVPFLCSSDMEFSLIVNDYLLWLSLENANTASPSTWKSQAEALYDYFSWLETNNLVWDSTPTRNPYGEEISNLAMYRNWSADLLDIEGRRKIENSTIRKRLSILMSFYRWAVKRGKISHVPWHEYKKAAAQKSASPSMYRHTYAGKQVMVGHLLPKVISKPVAFLMLNECKTLLKVCNNQTLQLITKLLLQSGIRNEECRTFPSIYIFDPTDYDSNRRIAINLSPNDMKIKRSKPRRIYISRQLMKELFDYLNFGEGARRAKLYRKTHGEKSPFLFLNQEGESWSEKGLNNAYRKLWRPENNQTPKLNFRVTPHMLRHTFATLELYAESSTKGIGAALSWVRDRLGHTSINTTTIYVHCLDMMGEADLNQYQTEIDSFLIQSTHGSH